MSRRSNDIKLQRQKAQSRIYPDKPTDVDPKVKQSMADAIANYTGPITRIPPVKKKRKPRIKFIQWSDSVFIDSERN